MKTRIRKWKRGDQIMLFENLTMYISAGLPLDSALTTMKPGLSKPKQIVIGEIIKNVENGVSLSSLLKKYLKISGTIAGLIEHGESSGQLAKSLGLAGSIIEREDALIKTCLSAMAYPAIIGIFACLLTIGLMKGVMPQIIPLLKSLHVELPILTKVVIYISDNMNKYSLLLLLLSVVVLSIFIYFYKKFIWFKGFCHNIILHIPIIKKLVRYYIFSIMLRSFGALIESGALIEQSYEKVVSTVSIIPIKNILLQESSNISRGVSIGLLMNKNKDIPNYVSSLIAAGESSGSLGISLVRAADILDKDINHALKRLTALIEPVMMVGMGCGVGAIALSIMMPIYDVSKALQH